MRKKGLIISLLFICISIFYIKQDIFSLGKTFEQFESEEEEEEEQSGIDKQMLYWFQSRAYPDPYNLNEKYELGWQQALAIKQPNSSAKNNSATSAQWTSIGPSKNIGGRILTIAINPVKSTSLFVGSASGGIWKSYSGGSDWQRVVTNTQVLGVSSIIINPADTNVIYAGTGEVYRLDSTSTTPNPGNTGFNVWKTRGTYGIGILKSTDGGTTWSKVFAKNISDLFAIQTLKFDPTNSSIVYACATDGLYRSTNAGASWVRLLDATMVTDVVVNAANTQEIVAAVGNLGNTIKGIYKSSNGGANWTKITSGLPANFLGFIKMDYVTTDPSVIIASIGVSKAAGVTELYRSSDFGNSWLGLGNSDHTQWQYWSAHDVAINPSNTNKLIFAGVTTYSGTITVTVKGNGSTTISHSSTSIGSNIHDDIHDIKFDPTNSNNIYVCCDGGVFKSTNGGTGFTAMNNGLAATQFYAPFGVSAQTANLFVGGLQDNGQVVYNGTSWTTVAGVGGDGTACAIDPSNDNKMVVSRDARGIYASTNKGGSASGIASYWGSTYDSRTAFCAPLAYAKSNPSIIYAASDNLHKSTNLGTFTFDAGTSATNYIEAKNKTAVTLAVSPTNANKIYVSTSPFAQYDNDVDDIYVNGSPNVLKTLTGNTPFTSIKSNLPNRFVMDFAISPTNDDSVFAVLGGFGTSHIYVTGNGGTSWTSIGSGGVLPDVPFNAVLIDPLNPQVLYVGTDFGVYVSPNRGATWLDYNNGLWDATLVMDIQATADNKLVLATHGKGAFVGPLYTAPLPVTIRSFDGVSNEFSNQLYWITEDEKDLDRYEVERSTDGINFYKIGFIKSANTTGTHNYEYTDPLMLSPSDKLYYRLKSIDIDGSFSYSRVIALQKKSDLLFSVLQNPFRDNISVSIYLNESNFITSSLFDNKGRLIQRQRFNATKGMNLFGFNNLQNLPAGVYFLEAIIGQQRKTAKLIKE